VSPRPSTGTCSTPAWDSGKTYSDQVVSHKGRLWKARWWTQNNEPGTNEVWADNGTC
jgi:chitinase